MAAMIQASAMNLLKLSDYYRLNRIKEFYSPKFQTEMADYNVKFANLAEIPPEKYADRLKSIMADVITSIIGPTENKYARFYLNMPSLKNPINLPYMTADELTGARILREIERIQNSNDKVKLDAENANIHIICTAKDTPGAGWSDNGSCRDRTIISLVEWLRMKKGAIEIRNNDKLCLARALVVAQAHYNNSKLKTTETAAYFRKIRHPASPFQTACAQQLHKDAGVPLKACGLPEIQLFQSHLEREGYRIIVFSAEENFEKMFTGPKACTKLIHIIKHGNHYDVITSPAALFNTSYYCELCLTGLNHIEAHICIERCKACRDSSCKTLIKYPTIKCSDCQRYFYASTCLKNHKDNGTCTALQRCKHCNNQFAKGSPPHTCDVYRCSYCLKHVQTGHLCFVQKLGLEKSGKIDMEAKDAKDTDAKEETSTLLKVGSKRKMLTSGGPRVKKSKHQWKKENPIVYYYDIEAMQETGTHIANLIVVQREDGKQWVFEQKDGGNPRDAFCNWIFKKHCDEEEPKPSIFIAHYAKGYDSYFVLDYIHDHCVFPKVITTGSKYMLIEVPQLKLKFIDSHNFIGTSLKEFPKMFELSELKKGFFPHLFNTVKNQNYSGPIPPQEAYNPSSLSTAEYMLFIEWHNKQRSENMTYNLQDELKAYCISDVQILRQGCEKFRKSCIADHHIDPFTTSITIASYCHKVYRMHYMPENSIGIVPSGGYGRNTKYSIMALQWLMWIEHSENVAIKHARNGGEVKIGPYYVDGCETAQKIAYEFHGCLYHGCPVCYDEDDESPLGQGRMGDLYAKSEDRIQRIQEIGYSTRVIWECQFKQLLKDNHKMANYLEGIKIVQPLNPRDAFYGGRTDVSRMYHEACADEEIHYMDFVSLYPTINKYGKMPVGHPKIILPEGMESYVPGKYYGFVKCKVLPPTELYHAVLPYKCNGKLIFALCKACADSSQSTKCNHTETERGMVGTWTTPEMDTAIAKGYVLQEIYEIWHYAQTAEYGCEDYPNGLFGDYVNAMLKSKQEASGWPEDVVTNEEKDAYIDEYHKKEGILLNKSKIVHNPGQRSLAKLMLNSLWGKFGQRNELPKTEYVTSRYRLLELISSPDVEVRDALLVNSEMMMVSYVTKENHQKASGFTSVPIAAFTTALARLKLYAILEIVKENAIYMDTDSLIYICKKSYDPLKHMIGSHLGDMTDEIGQGHYIKEFVSGGPKNYAYETSSGKKIWKIKGITQNFKTDAKINYEVIKAMVTEPDATNKVVLHNSIIKRNKHTTQLQTIDSTKSYGIMYDKGIIDEKLKIWPYGFSSS